jgi:nucleotide-binding universal stress UspA family protein
MTVDINPIASTTNSQESAAAADIQPPGGLALVVGHDGHPASNAALSAGIDLAQRLGAHLHVVHSITLDDYGIDPDIDGFEQECEGNLAHERETIADTLAGTSVNWTYHEERGDPAGRLAQLATAVNASFIIVGATSPGMLNHLLSGSVPKRLLHHQGHLILVVPPAPGPTLP